MSYGAGPLSRTPGGDPAATRRSWYSGLKLLAVLLVVMWLLAVLEAALPGNLYGLGIQSWSFDGLLGILIAPFLHADFGHLIANTVPLVVLGLVIALSGAARLLAVSALVIGISGIGVWLANPPGTLTIGASGLVFGFAAYLIVRGLFNKRLLQLVIGAAVIFLWGSALLGGIIPQGNGISWQAHLFGAVGGVVAAWILADYKPAAKVA